MPTFDVVSQVDMQEVANALDQARREVSTRFDFKGTESGIELAGHDLTLRSSTEDRLKALVLLVEEKLVKRKVSLKAIDYGKVEDAAKGTVRQQVTIKAGISADNARAINRFVKDKAPKGVASQTQGEQLRVSAKKRDDLQAVIALLKAEDFGIPLQFENFRE
ncbi:MAG: YajQ family cyclic di-GMP-binding protein [Acidimicrobiales bacterium]